MKIIKISSLILLGGALMFNSSCKKTFYTDANINHNAPTSMVPSLILPTVEGSLAYVQGGDLSRFASMFVQQTYSASRQCGAYYQYILTNQDVDNCWANMYTSVLMNDDSLMVPSDNSGYNRYSGVSRILMAYSLLLTSDFWGDVPFSEAFKGMGNIKPKFDAANSVYTSILKLCDDGIDKMKNPSAGIFTPGAEDIIYQGDSTKWIKFAHAIKARIYMHQSKGSAANANLALAEIAASFSDNSDNAKYTFDTKETFSNPWYQFNEQRDDITFTSSTMITNMLANDDPRVYMMVDTLDPLTGGDGLNANFGAISSAVEFISYDELQFMKAEAIIATGGSLTAAQAAYQDGIMANMTKLGVSATDAAAYITANGTLTAANALSKIATEEYIALYLNPEAWTLWRRTGYPALTPVKGTAIPRRMLYPQTELSYNTANVPAATMYSPKIFWDK